MPTYQSINSSILILWRYITSCQYFVAQLSLTILIGQLSPSCQDDRNWTGCQTSIIRLGNVVSNVCFFFLFFVLLLVATAGTASKIPYKPKTKLNFDRNITNKCLENNWQDDSDQSPASLLIFLNDVFKSWMFNLDLKNKFL